MTADEIVDVLDDGALTAVGLLASTGAGGYAMYKTDLIKIGNIGGAAGQADPASLPFSHDGTTAQAGYFRMGNKLQRLRWSADSASFEAPIHTFTSAVGSSLFGSSDSSAYYFPDGLGVWKVAGGDTSSLVAQLTAGNSIQYVFAGERDLLLVQSDGSSRQNLSAVPKPGGAVVGLASSVNFGAYTADSVVYTDDSTRLSRAIDFDGQNDRSLGPIGSLGAGTFFRRDSVNDQMYAQSSVVCVPTSTGDTTCSGGGELREVDIASGQSIRLGILAALTSPFSSVLGVLDGASDTPPAAGGVTLLATSSAGVTPPPPATAASRTDFYLVVQGVADSLLRLTTRVP
ncbi:hypothetical protein [Rhizobacter fulvus]